ncbi:hypothetical protein [Lysinibacillus xylanilyticus]|uniref:hypothetical protein n=1 Tax=Lysinibacillus xylanilyticus TaxID=582475 RepID=UPI00381E5CC7
MRESVVLTQRQQRVFVCSKAKQQRQQHDVGHSVVATGCAVLRLSSSISTGCLDTLRKVT